MTCHIVYFQLDYLLLYNKKNCYTMCHPIGNNFEMPTCRHGKKIHVFIDTTIEHRVAGRKRITFLRIENGRIVQYLRSLNSHA